MIQPTVGRVVLFTPSKHDQNIDRIDDKPMAAIITSVWDERTVNLVIFGHNGYQWSKLGVMLLQDDDPAPQYGDFCEWMPYQKGQAAKTEDLTASATATFERVEKALMGMAETIAVMQDQIQKLSAHPALSVPTLHLNDLTGPAVGPHYEGGTAKNPVEGQPVTTGAGGLDMGQATGGEPGPGFTSEANS